MSSNNPTIRPSILFHNSLNTVSNPFSMPVHFVAITGTENEFGMVFHFRLSLVSQRSATAYEAIRLDIRPNYTDPNPNYRMHAVVRIEYTRYAYSHNHSPRPFVVPVTQGNTAGMILDIIFEKYSMVKYIFAPPGQGCRHWCANGWPTNILSQRVSREISRVMKSWNTQGSEATSRCHVSGVPGTFDPYQLGLVKTNAK